MTCDERIEALLNRAGQTISDLPKIYTDTLVLSFAVLMCGFIAGKD